MKKKIFVVSLFLILALSFGLLPTQAQEAAPAKKTVKILTIGNSFAESLHRYFPQVVASTGDCELVFGCLNIGGCSFERHWGNIEKEIADPTTPAYFKETYLSKIKSQDWDFISIQQVSGKSWIYDSYQPFADKMIEFLKANSNAEIVIQQTWAYHPTEKRLVGWGFPQREMYEKLTDAYNTLAKKHSLRVIPTGDAVQLARETEPGGYDPADPTKIFTSDGAHLNARGQYLQACVWFGMLFDEPVSKVKFQPKELTAEDAAFLREVAQKAIDARKN
ncbi:MAG: DUF4886 domain-containing protein [Thermoguttaceae bacterium]|nr:DUF4886 domain-containing protein [Thermoguttaceae bacterium]MBR0190978.1 DUF4886 domain-containing protein [Thermoguttaceae bacterium]